MSARDGGDLENGISTLDKARKELEMMMAEFDRKLQALDDMITRREAGPEARS